MMLVILAIIIHCIIQVLAILGREVCEREMWGVRVCVAGYINNVIADITPAYLDTSTFIYS